MPILLRSFILALAIPALAIAQSTLSLPKLLPAYTEDFSSRSSFPSVCFDNVFIDKNGRLFLTTCMSARNMNSLYLFQFDGYDFMPVREGLEKLGQKTGFAGLQDQRVLVGFEIDTALNRLSFYDLQTNKLRFENFESPGIFRRILLSEDNGIFLIFEKEDHLEFYEWKDAQLNLRSKAVFPATAKERKGGKHIYFYDKESCWLAFNDQPYFLRVDTKTGAIRKYSSTDIQGGVDFRKLNSNWPMGQDIKMLRANELYLTGVGDQEKKLYRFNTATDRFDLVENIPEGWTSEHIAKDKSGNLVFLFRDKNGKYQAILQDPSGKRYDYSAFFEELGNPEALQLIGTDFRRELIIANRSRVVFHLVKSSETILHFLSSASIRAMVELPGGKFLVSTQSNGAFLIHEPGNTVSRFGFPDCDMEMLGRHYQFIPDVLGNIWTHQSNFILKFNLELNTCEKFYCTPNNIRHAKFAGNGRIAVVDNTDALFFYDLSSRQTQPFLRNGTPLRFDGFTNDILFGKNGWLWIATTKGLWKVNPETRQSEVIGLSAPFQDFRFVSIHQDAKGRLWLGTTLGGLHIYDPDSGEVHVLNVENGLANNTVVSVLEDNDGVRWVSTYNGISLVSPEGQLIANLYQEDGLTHREFNRYAYLKASDGRLFLGGVQGLNIIDPQKIKERLLPTDSLKIYLTALNYFDSGTGKDTLRRSQLTQLETIHLPASRRYLNLSFAASNYFKPEKNLYAYKLEGANPGDESRAWTYIGGQRKLSLNSLPAGKYSLLIKAADANGFWTQDPLAIPIEAGEYFHKQIWFYLLLMGVLASVALLWIYRLRAEVKFATKKIMEDKATIEQQAGQLQELDKAKSRFFTNISHEFRTPLTIISGMASQIKQNPQLWVDKGTDMIRQNSANLLNLVNQILDLRKLEHKELQIHMVQGDVIQYLRYITESYHSYAQNKGLQLHFLSARPTVIMDYDPDKMLRIISNLLSNAVKYTPDGGHVYFHLDQKTEDSKEYLEIRVQDTGTGIPEDKLAHIFDRFYQVEDSYTGEGKPARAHGGGGTGIGLALTSELVKLLNGRIDVSSELEKGSTFLVKLPITRESKIQEAVPVSAPPFLSGVASLERTEDSEERSYHQGSAIDNEKPTLLIVEDNSDVQQYLIACLQESYQLDLAGDGQEGIDKAIELVPDLIVSDVMMPKKDGFELCDKLKNDERTSHIPIILLTAKADQESKISGLEKGADAYLAKPFEQKELLVRLNKLLELRKRLQEHYRSYEPSEKAASPEDLFIQKVRNAIEARLDDESFGIVHLCRAVGLSRAQLHNKLKALTGNSTSIFIRSVRLRKAKDLLQTTGLNVSEVAFEVGFKDPKYFSRLFTEEFGIPPSKTHK